MRQGDHGIDKKSIERAARLYSTNQAASQALGIEARSFSRLCRRYGSRHPTPGASGSPRRIALGPIAALRARVEQIR